MRSSLFAGLWTSWILASALAASPAAAREFKPRILLVFDTSGSMGFNLATGEATGGDNSREYPGNGGDSPAWSSKRAPYEALELARTTAWHARQQGAHEQ
jgi:hypothetical protein